MNDKDNKADLLYQAGYSDMFDTMLPFFLNAIIATRFDLRKLFNSARYLSGKNKIFTFIYWWVVGGRFEYPKCQWEWEREYLSLLNAPSESIKQDLTMPITNTMVAVWEFRPDLQALYDLDTKEGREKFLHWVDSHGKMEDPLLVYISKVQAEEIPKKVIADEIIERAIGTNLKGGINIAGFARGELGIGEDVRMAALSAIAADIPFSIYDAPMNSSIKSSVSAFDQYIKDEPAYHTNLICMPCAETYQLYLNAGAGFFNHRYNIGAWQWELPHFPEEWKPFYNLVDEVWAFSRYAYEMYLASSPVPVTYMPMAVEYPVPSDVTRAQFNLPENKFLFLFMFDGNSWMTRKNPLAAIRAFEKAFPTSNQEVGLVIKAMNVNEQHPDWLEIQKMAAQDSRMTIKNVYLSRADVMALINACDSFVSLHRAEGFGRLIAEAMLLQKPVIVTNFSGNCDFTNINTAFLVNGPRVFLKEGDYSVWENQYWCDPDIDEAAKQMQVCFEDKKLRDKIASNGSIYIKTYHSAQAVGTLYKKRLREIGVIG